MSETTQRGAAAADGEQRSDDTPSKEALSGREDERSPHPGGKASTAPEEENKECTTDTINDGDGNYLEPPD
jgi:hypothetical protein